MALRVVIIFLAKLRRREFITLLGGAARTARRARAAVRTRASHRRAHGRGSGRTGDAGPHRGFLQGLRNPAGRWPQRADRHPLERGDAARLRRDAAELVALGSRSSWPVRARPYDASRRAAPCRSCWRRADPVGASFVESLARPGGNATGFNQLDYSLGGKWLELLKEIAPKVTRAAVCGNRPRRDRTMGRHPVRSVVARGGIQALNVQRDAEEVERASRHSRAAEWRADRCGERGVATSSQSHRHTRRATPNTRGLLPYRFFVTGGGLISYGAKRD